MVDEFDTYVDNVVARAKRYIDANKNPAPGTYNRLAATTDADTKLMSDSDITTFLTQDSHPYDSQEIRAAVERILHEKLDQAQSAPEGQDRNVTYLAGAYGSRQLLEDMAKNPQSEEIAEMKGLLATSVSWNFDELKQLLHKTADINLKPYGEPPYEQYAKWRGLLSGIDTELADIATNKRLHYVIDNSMTPRDDGEKQKTLAGIDRDRAAGKHLHIFAVALTPQEARDEVQKQGIGATPEEAESTARRFQSVFNDIKEHAPDVTLVDRSGKVIYKQRGGELKYIDAEAMGAWRKSFENEVTAPNVEPGTLTPPKTPQNGGGGKGKGL